MRAHADVAAAYGSQIAIHQQHVEQQTSSAAAQQLASGAAGGRLSQQEAEVVVQAQALGRRTCANLRCANLSGA